MAAPIKEPRLKVVTGDQLKAGDRVWYSKPDNDATWRRWAPGSASKTGVTNCYLVVDTPDGTYKRGFEHTPQGDARLVSSSFEFKIEDLEPEFNEHGEVAL